MDFFFAEARKSFHASLLKSVLKTDDDGVPSIADRHSPLSVAIAKGIISKLGKETIGARLAGQMSGSKFEEICTEYLKETFLRLNHMRPGKWVVQKGLSGGRMGISLFDQYEHLAALEIAAKNNPDLAAALGNDYLIKPDIVIFRLPEDDDEFNIDEILVGDADARLTPLRQINNSKPILHASVSCKWTIRSDRAQNARSEALNLVRNRKGRLPHIGVVTGEPLPNRIASIALGTGDIDCVYHFALNELVDTVNELGYLDAAEMLQTMIGGKRLRDISDLPIDLII
jgi:hypothetical protein